MDNQKDTKLNATFKLRRNKQNYTFYCSISKNSIGSSKQI